MSGHKKQHYVPRFYLRNFSSSGGRSINIFNIKSRKKIIGGNLRNQCYEPFFYGNDLNVENALSEFECHAATVLDKIVKCCKPPAEDSEQHYALAAFLTIQRSRTKFSAEMHDEMADTMFKAIYRDDPRLAGINLNNFRLKLNNPAVLPTAISAQYAPVVMDLRLHLFQNDVVSTEFITSESCCVIQPIF